MSRNFMTLCIHCQEAFDAEEFYRVGERGVQFAFGAAYAALFPDKLGVPARVSLDGVVASWATFLVRHENHAMVMADEIGMLEALGGDAKRLFGRPIESSDLASLPLGEEGARVSQLELLGHYRCVQEGLASRRHGSLIQVPYNAIEQAADDDVYVLECVECGESLLLGRSTPGRLMGKDIVYFDELSRSIGANEARRRWLVRLQEFYVRHYGHLHVCRRWLSRVHEDCVASAFSEVGMPISIKEPLPEAEQRAAGNDEGGRWFVPLSDAAYDFIGHTADGEDASEA